MSDILLEFERQELLEPQEQQLPEEPRLVPELCAPDSATNLRATATGQAYEQQLLPEQAQQLLEPTSDSRWSKRQILELQTTDTGAQAGATDTGAYESKLQKLLELRVTDHPGAKGLTVALL